MKPINPRTVRAVDRAIDILVTLGDRDFRLVGLSERLHLHKATVSRLLETMGRAGMVTRTGSGGYSVGARMVLLAGQLLRRHRHIAEALRDPLHRIWKQTAETVALHVRVGLERLCVAELETLQPIGYRAGIGTRAPLHVGAPSKVLLAFIPEPEQTSVLEGLARKAAEDGVELSLVRLREELDRIRSDGYATSFGEYISGAFAVSVPVSDVSGSVVAALSVHGPESRFTREVMAQYASLIVREIRPLAVSLPLSEGDGGALRRKTPPLAVPTTPAEE
ncbi:MAG: IclR family transcriptional regulator [Candidatus Rokubacteria bacterium]|nr:IclR family transcriptional regulator [Candidatus Rokubacteria bacterium]